MIQSPEARQRALQLLSMVNIREPPVDVDGIARFLGFIIIPYDFPNTVSGVTFIEGDVKSIGVNSSHAPTRQRFSAAHEIGHYLLGHDSYDEKKVYIDDRPSFLNPHNLQEMEANEFAAELLMPESFLRQDVAQYGLDASSLARRYLVSEQAMWIQLMDHQLADEYQQS